MRNYHFHYCQAVLFYWNFVLTAARKTINICRVRKSFIENADAGGWKNDEHGDDG